MRKRSKYRPKPVALDSWKIGMQGAMRLSVADQIKASSPVKISVERAAKSQQTQQDWRDIFDALNLIEAMASLGVVKQASGFIDAHQQNIVHIMDRHRTTGSNVVRPIEVEMLRDLAATWAEVLDICTHRELFAAQELVIKRVNSVVGKKAGNYEGVQVVQAVAA